MFRWNIWILVKNDLIVFTYTLVFQNCLPQDFLHSTICQFLATFSFSESKFSDLFNFINVYPIRIFRKRPYLSQTTGNKKNKGTLPSQTLKVWEENVPSEFRLFAYWPRYSHFKIIAIPNLEDSTSRNIFVVLSYIHLIKGKSVVSSEFWYYDQKLN